MPADPRQLAARFLDEAAGEVLDLANSNPALAGEVSRAVGQLLIARADRVTHPESVDEVLWSRYQEQLTQLADAEGSDSGAVAGAIFFAMTRQMARGVEPLHESGTRLLLREMHNEVARVVHERTYWDDERDAPFLDFWVIQALKDLRGPAGAEWFLVLLKEDLNAFNGEIQDVLFGKSPAWNTEDWNLRLHGVCDRLKDRPGFLDFVRWREGQPPRGACAAMVRVACTFGPGPHDNDLRHAAEIAGSHLSGNVDEDLELFWWEGAEENPEMLRMLIELSGPAGFRAGLIDAALDAGRIDQEAAGLLLEPVDRPEWADGEVPWTYDEIISAGSIVCPEGEVSGGDPWEAWESIPWTLSPVPSTESLEVRVAVARQSTYARENAAAELIVSDGPPASWQLIESAYRHGEGYAVAVGVGCFSSTGALRHALDTLEDGAEFQERGQCAHKAVDLGSSGGMVMFTVGPQHQDCRSWVGRDESGAICRIVTDLGLIDIDPTRHRLPWM